MSTPHNTPPQPSRGRRIAVVLGAIIAPIAAVIAGCSTDGPTGPQPNGRVALAAAPAFNAAPVPPPPPKPSPKDSANRVTPTQLAVEASSWHTQSSDKESGQDRPLNISCGFTGQYTVSQPIGTAGGVLTFGKSSLTIPKGALSTTTQISATITLGSSVTVDFQPHGLQFAKAATIKADFTGCTVPSSSPGLNVYYLTSTGGIAQSMPSAKASSTVVQALTDHFSGYAVSWGRADASSAY